MKLIKTGLHYLLKLCDWLGNLVIALILAPVSLVASRKKRPRNKRLDALFAKLPAPLRNALNEYRTPRRTAFLLALTIIVLLLPVAVIHYLRPTAVEAGWFNDNWHYRRALTVNNAGAADSNKKVKFDIDTTALIAAGKMQDDCGDSRFTDVNGDTLEYYLDSAGGACNTNSTDYYVLVPTIHAGETLIYYYYGNSSATNGSKTNQFAEATFSPSLVTTASEETGPGPIAHWSFDEGSGQTAHDSTEHGNNGTLGTTSSPAADDPVWQEEGHCISGKCLVFDGVDDSVKVAFNESLVPAPTSNWTTEIWFRSSDTDGGLISKYDDSNYWYYRIFLEGGKVVGSFGSHSDFANTEVISPSTYNDNQWHHAAITYDHSTVSLYVDGLVVATSTLSGDFSSSGRTDGICIGTDIHDCTNPYGDTHGFFLGSIDEPKIYPYARSAEEIRQDYVGQAQAAGVVLGAADQSALSDGLVGYWKMDEAGIDAEGEVISDYSGNGNDGTLYGDNSTGDNGTGMDCTSAGKFGTSCSFDGTDDYVTIPNNEIINTDQGSVALWVKPNPGSSPNYFVFSYPGAGTQSRIYIRTNDTGTTLSGMLGDGTTIGNATITASAWHHVVLSWDGTQSKFYVDGEDVTDNTVFNGLTGSVPTLYLGSYVGGENLNGSTDELRIYNRALSPAEVQQLYQYAPGPVGYWPFDEGGGTTTADKTGNGHDGTLEDNPEWTQGKFGKGLSFDGSNQRVRIPDDTSLHFDNVSFTVSTWVKPHQSNRSAIVRKGQATRRQGYGIFTTEIDSAELIYSDTFDSGDHLLNDGSVPVGEWSYITQVVDRSSETVSLYVNGKYISSMSIAGITSSNTGDLLIGDDGAYDAQATIDEVKLYNYARTPAQIRQDMSGAIVGGGIGNPLPDPVSHWSFDEGYGTTAHDVGGGGNDGTINGASWTSEGRVGKALSFDGSDDWVEVTNQAGSSLTMDSEITITAWVNPTSFTQQTGIVNRLGSVGLSLTLDGRPRMIVRDGSTYPQADSPEPLSTDHWYHIAGTYNATKGEIEIYVDGEVKKTTALSTTMMNATNSWVIGSYLFSPPNVPFTGTIDEVKIYNTALTADQVKLDMNQGAAHVLGATSTDASGAPSTAAAREYCVPGDTSYCAPPVGEWKFDENQGTTANDTSGNGNTGTISGASWTRGEVGAALGFDGMDDYVTISDSASTSPTSEISVSTWVKPEEDWNAGTERKDILYKGGSYYLILNLSGSDGKISFIAYDSGNQEVKTSTTSWNANTWYHIAGTYDGTTLNVFVNGKLENSVSNIGAIVDSSQPLNLGTNGNASGNFLNGQIDHVKIYDYARTPAQIAWDYNRGKPVGHWRFDECQGTTAHDSSGNGNDGTITIGGTGTQTSAGTCQTAGTAWGNGQAGKMNSSLSFDGGDDYVVVPDSSSLKPTHAITLAGWTKVDTSQPDGESRLIDRFSNAVQGYLLNSAQTPGIPSMTLVIDTTGNQAIQATTNIADDQWHHVVGTWDGSEMRIYIDGALDNVKGSVTGVIDYDDSFDLTIGDNNQSQIRRRTKGEIDDVRIYNYALTDEQVKLLYNGDAAIRYAPAVGNP